MGKDAGAAGSRRGRPSLVSIGLFVAVVLLGVAAVFLDLGALWQTIRGTDPLVILAALAASAASFVALAFAWAYLARLLGIQAAWRSQLGIGFIAAALNNVLSAGGVAGHSARVALLADRGVPKGDTLAASTFHAYVTNAVLLGLLPLGLLHVLLFQGLPTGAIIPLSILAGLALVLIGLMSWIVFHGRLRRALLERLGRLLEKVLRGKNVDKGLRDFESTMQRATRLVGKQRGRLLLAVGVDTLDWLLTAATLWVCFYAVGVPLPIGVLLTGTVVGIAVGLASAIPAGLVVMEASMTGVFALLGVPVEQAVVAAVIFRVVYHVVPFLAAIFVYARMLGVSPLNLFRGGRLIDPKKGNGNPRHP